MFSNISAKRVEKRCCAFYHPSSNLSCNKSGCYTSENLLQRVENVSTFRNKICTRWEFYRPKVNLPFSKRWRNFLVWRDSRVVSSNQKSVFTQLAAKFRNNLQPVLQQSFGTTCTFLTVVCFYRNLRGSNLILWRPSCLVPGRSRSVFGGYLS